MEPETGLIGGTMSAIATIMGWGDEPLPPVVIADPVAQVITLSSGEVTEDFGPGDVTEVAFVVERDRIRLDLALNDARTIWFALYTQRHLGEVVEVQFCRQTYAVAVVQEPIAAGRLAISGVPGDTMFGDEVALLSGDMTCAEYLSEEASHGQ